MNEMTTLANIERRISFHIQGAYANILEVGRCLIEAKESGLVPHGEWEAWVERTAGMSDRSAQRIMRAAREGSRRRSVRMGASEGKKAVTRNKGGQHHMKIEAQKPNIVRIAYHQEKGDPHYGSCMWAYFDFDLEKYMLNIQSDCGNAAYRWIATPESESFLQLMSRIYDDYLIEKLFKRCIVDVDDTVREIREWLGIVDDEDFKDDDLSREEWERLDNAVIELEGRLNEYTQLDYDLAERIAEDWQSEYSLDIDCIWDRVVTDFTAGQKRIVQIFRDYIQPEVKRLAIEEANTTWDISKKNI